MLSVKGECLQRIVLFGERTLPRAVRSSALMKASASDYFFPLGYQRAGDEQVAAGAGFCFREMPA